LGAADWKSAIQQVGNLRYEDEMPGAIQGRRLGFDERDEVGHTPPRQNNTMQRIAFARPASGLERPTRAACDPV
jgi:hypothetical protein